MSFLINLCLELQQSILEHLSDSPEALSSMALSCQSLHEPATRILWRRVEGFQQIVSLFPEDNPLRISPFSLSEFQDSRDFTDDELERISRYCGLVRHVERVYTEDLCLMLEKLPSDRFPYLFPNLRSIECQHLWTRGSDRILSPSVVRNCFTTRGYHTWSIDPFMIPIALEEESYPLLTHLEFQLFNRAFRGEFALITRCPNLQYLEVFSADGPIMNYLSQLPNLRVLRFLSLEEMPPTFDAVAPFPSLVELFLGETTAQRATSFLHAVSSSSLTTIQVELKDGRISSVSLDAMVHSLVNHHSKNTLSDLDFFTEFYRMECSVGSSTILPFLQLPNIRSFRWNIPFEDHDDRMWPRWMKIETFPPYPSSNSTKPYILYNPRL